MGLQDVGTGPGAVVTRRAPGWLGAGGALLGLVTYALPWYTVSGGASYSGFSLISLGGIPYETLAQGPQGGACFGALSGYNLPVTLLAGTLAAALVGCVAMRWLQSWRSAAFALALALLAASWLALLVLLPWIGDALSSTPAVTGPWSCRPAGSLDVALFALMIGVVMIGAASLWHMALALPATPWLLGGCAALGLLGFVAPWELSLAPGVWRFVSAASCAISAGWNAPGCVPMSAFPEGAPLSVSTGAIAQLTITVNLPFYAAQALMLLAVLLVALWAARRRTARRLRALQVVSLIAGVLGLLSGILLELLIAVTSFSLGASVVALAFLLLAIFTGRAGEESRVRRLEEGVGSLTT